MSLLRNRESTEDGAPRWDDMCNRAARDRFRRRLGDSSASRQPIDVIPYSERRPEVPGRSQDQGDGVRQGVTAPEGSAS